MGFRMLRSAAAVLAVVLLAGCVPGEPVVTPEPDPDVTPLFASDEEALAAATEAYAKYLEVSDQILADGGLQPERLRDVATSGWVEVQLQGFDRARAEGLHSTGFTTFDHLSLERYDPGAIAGTEIVRVYVCIDVSGVDVLDGGGQSVVSETRPDRSPAEVVFTLAEKHILLVDQVDPWGGRDFCA